MAMSEKFLNAVSVVLKHEGGYVNDKNDPGGETKYGISKRSYPNLDIKALSKQDAIAIYYRDWWLPNRYEEIVNEELAAKVFDLAVNMGAWRTNKLLQRSVNITQNNLCLIVDGIIGNKTLKAVNSHHLPQYLLAVLKLEAIEYYLKLNNSNYMNGWVARVLA